MTLRLDAARNREALLRAAADVLREHGAEAPLQLVADRAGVGRGTLYRHFPDRAALAVGVYERRVSDIESVARASTDPALALRVLDRVLDGVADAPGLVRMLRDSESGSVALDGMSERLLEVLGEPVARAHRAGLLRPGVDAVDLMAAWAMVEGVLLAATPDRREEMYDRARRLVHTALLTDQGREVATMEGTGV